VGFGDVAQIIGYYYSIDKGKVYYKNKILEGANPKTAELIGFSLLKDDKNVYYMGERIKDIKIKNFEKLGQNYWKNENKIYYRDKKIENADIMSFKVLNEDYAKDKNHVYSGNEVIDPSPLLGKIKNPETFEFLPNGIRYDTLYGKDKYNVYYINNIMSNCFDSYYFIYEVKIPNSYVDKSLSELNLRHKYEINILAIKHSDGKMNITPDPNMKLGKDDLLVVLARESTIGKIV